MGSRLCEQGLHSPMILIKILLRGCMHYMQCINDVPSAGIDTSDQYSSCSMESMHEQMVPRLDTLRAFVQFLELFCSKTQLTKCEPVACRSRPSIRLWRAGVQRVCNSAGIHGLGQPQ